MVRSTCAVVAVSVSLSVMPSLQGAPFFQGLGDLPGGGFNSRANDVSADGRVVVGRGISVNGAEAFRWSRAEGLVGLRDSLEGGSFTEANAVSADGSVIVGRGFKTVWNIGFISRSAIRWAAGAGATELSPGSADAVSADGSIVIGNSSLSGDWSEELFRWTESTGSVAIPVTNTRVFPGAISGDGSVVVGSYNYGNGISLDSVLPFRWSQDEGYRNLGSFDFSLLRFSPRTFGNNITDPLGSAAWVSNDGEMIIGSATDIIFSPPTSGYNNPPAQVFEMFWWTSETGRVKLGARGSPSDASADGTIIVGGFNGAFIWDATNGMQDLKGVLVTDFGLDLTGWTLTGATGISDDGFTIVGYGVNPDGFSEAWIAVIPEPGTCGLLIGLLAMGRALRCRSF